MAFFFPAVVLGSSPFWGLRKAPIKDGSQIQGVESQGENGLGKVSHELSDSRAQRSHDEGLLRGDSFCSLCEV